MAKRKSPEPCTAPTVDREWQARNDLDTLRRAGEIVNNKSRMSAAKTMATKEMQGLSKIVGKTGGNGLGFAKK